MCARNREIGLDTNCRIPTFNGCKGEGGDEDDALDDIADEAEKAPEPDAKAEAEARPSGHTMTHSNSQSEASIRHGRGATMRPSGHTLPHCSTSMKQAREMQRFHEEPFAPSVFVVL